MPHHQNTLSAVTIQTKFLKIFVHCQVINSLACAIFLCHLVFSSTNIYTPVWYLTAILRLFHIYLEMTALELTLPYPVNGSRMKLCYNTYV